MVLREARETQECLSQQYWSLVVEDISYTIRVVVEVIDVVRYKRRNIACEYTSQACI